MTLPSWLQALQTVGEAFLMIFPATASLAPLIIAAVSAAEAIPGATGPQKLSASLAIVSNGAQIAKASGVNLDPAVINEAAASAISTAVLIANIVSGVKTPAAAVAAQSMAVV